MNKSPRRILRSQWTPLTLLMVIISGVLTFILSRTPAFAQTAQATPIAQENRKTKFVIQPEYPELAKKNNISGTARVQAVIAADGTVKEVKILGGSPVLAQAAVEAVKKWRYEPASAVTTAVLKFDFKPGQ